MRFLQRSRAKRDQQIKGIEDFLMEAFSPVAPSQEFVSDLKDQLSVFTLPTPPPPAKIGQYTFYALVLVLGGGFVFAVLIRLMITLIAVISLINQDQPDQSGSA